MDSAGSIYYYNQSTPSFKESKPSLSAPTPRDLEVCTHNYTSMHIAQIKVNTRTYKVKSLFNFCDPMVMR